MDHAVYTRNSKPGDHLLSLTYLMVGRTPFSVMKCSTSLRLGKMVKWCLQLFPHLSSLLCWIVLSRAPHSDSCQLISDKVPLCKDYLTFTRNSKKQNTLHIPQSSHWQNIRAGRCLGFLVLSTMSALWFRNNLKTMNPSHLWWDGCRDIQISPRAWQDGMS